MRIQHNIMAMSAYRNYTNNVSAMKKNLEKLSSGYKINRAGDDAAGLAISEKMRAQITGLETAQKNAKDGISLVQTAEGALTEVHDMLNRMVELATQSANGTYDNATDRYQLQKEMNQLREEIDRIADSSNFNGIKLLDGSMAAGGAGASNVDMVIDTDSTLAAVTKSQPGSYKIDLTDFQIQLGGASGDTNTVSIVVGGVTVATVSAGATSATIGTITAGTLATAAASVTIGDTVFNVTLSNKEIVLTMAATPTEEFTEDMSVTVVKDDNTADYNTADTLAVKIATPAQVADIRKYAQAHFDLSKLTIADGAKLTIGDTEYVFKVGADSKVKSGNIVDLSAYSADDKDLAKYAAQQLSKTAAADPTFKVTSDNVTGTVYLTEKMGSETAKNANSTVDYDTNDLEGSSAAKDGNWKGLVKFAKATDGSSGSGLTLQIGDTADSFNQLKVNIGDTHCAALGIDAIKISDQTSAAAAVEAIKKAINTVSDIRGTLGATQNRLDHTMNNLGVMTENIQDAESTIRDVDVAEEMMAYTKNNILIQSAQAMLAQANQVPQGVLQLLQ